MNKSATKMSADDLTQDDVDRLCVNISKALSSIYSHRYGCDVKITAKPALVIGDKDDRKVC